MFEGSDNNNAYLVRRLKSLPAQFDAKSLVVTQGKVVSKDGTEVSYFLVKREGTATDGDTPTLLYGYGGSRYRWGPGTFPMPA